MSWIYGRKIQIAIGVLVLLVQSAYAQDGKDIKRNILTDLSVQKNSVEKYVTEIFSRNFKSDLSLLTKFAESEGFACGKIEGWKDFKIGCSYKKPVYFEDNGVGFYIIYQRNVLLGLIDNELKVLVKDSVTAP